MSFVSYVRVSTGKQGIRGLGIEAQREAVADYAKNKGAVVAEFAEVESGRNSSRPQLRAALAHAKATQSVLLIAKLDRLARKVSFIANLMESGVKFVAVDRPDAKPFELHIYAALAEEEARMISERTRAALAAKRTRLASEGKRLGNPRPAASLAKGMATRMAKADAGKAQIRKTIAAVQAGGVTTLRGIAAELNGRGVLSARGGQWSATQVSRVLAG
ncbi:hypothetical protein SB2_06865 [Methylobacterium radiotolerans]|uniref:recombinase family protein n=1 Tax=Methylobacterium sp. B1 TaxID=91459 RepID=UPI000348CC24|nr:recombinase family protein [Methylobacterium sp. B1]KTS10263.1 hypothetical protein SB3_08910 [Methylobacterium radiotolerans]KTS49268.1 hypothetical protein SB2_06865 [Methylobacterium radiotolerans]